MVYAMPSPSAATSFSPVGPGPSVVDLKGDGKKDGYVFAKFIDQVTS